MKRFVFSCALLAGLGHAAEIDLDGVGRDINGWDRGVARFATAGANFDATKPVVRYDENDNMIVTTVIRERKRTAPVFEGTLLVLVSPDGLVRTASIEGTVDGKDFKTGETTRPEPVTPVATEGGEETGASLVDVTPVSPEQAMRDSLKESVSSAVERARSNDKKLVKRDLSAWIFTSEASSGESLAEGVDAVFRSIYRRSGK